MRRRSRLPGHAPPLGQRRGVAAGCGPWRRVSDGRARPRLVGRGDAPLAPYSAAAQQQLRATAAADAGAPSAARARGRDVAGRMGGRRACRAGRDRAGLLVEGRACAARRPPALRGRRAVAPPAASARGGQRRGRARRRRRVAGRRGGQRGGGGEGRNVAARVPLFAPARARQGLHGLHSREALPHRVRPADDGGDRWHAAPRGDGASGQGARHAAALLRQGPAGGARRSQARRPARPPHVAAARHRRTPPPHATAARHRRTTRRRRCGPSETFSCAR